MDGNYVFAWSSLPLHCWPLIEGENNALSRQWLSNFSVLWTVYVPQILVEILIPIVMILGCAFFSRQLGLKGEALMMGLVPL